MPLKLWRGDATLMRRMTWWRNITEFYFLSSRPAFKRGGQVDEYKILWKEKAVERTSHYILIAVPTCNFVIGGPLFAYWRHTFCMSGQKKNSFVYSHFRDSAERGSWYILCLVYLFQSRHVFFFLFLVRSISPTLRWRSGSERKRPAAPCPAEETGRSQLERSVSSRVPLKQVGRPNRRNAKSRIK